MFELHKLLQLFKVQKILQAYGESYATLRMLINPTIVMISWFQNWHLVGARDTLPQPPGLSKAAPSKSDASRAHFSWPKKHLFIHPTRAALSMEPADPTEPIDGCRPDDVTASAMLQQLSMPPKASVHIKGYHNDRANVSHPVIDFDIWIDCLVESSTDSIQLKGILLDGQQQYIRH
jgi:hypothetical protein